MKITDRKIAYDGHYKLSKLTVQDGDKELQRERFEPGQAVAALVFDTQKEKFLLVQQYRVGAEADVLEIVAGMIDPEDKNPEEALRREIQEELGYPVDALIPIAEVYASPGNSAERHYIYYAEVSKQTGTGGGVASENEHLELVELTAEELYKEKLLDAKTLLATQWHQLFKQKYI
ncbi:NUDIX domain-containing protein [Hymenobacter profundi]|uniref:ADP-ribose pyrophosphatase n=1 Tax=Hymenobacter profundi TaxID=1982110 RepID=A0ABS6X274_9BACT|nr:NUDIX hydrolase [Hymenobacter profundi]MBW3129401.1 NUDIX hydrolase [Hymenobacter profundi]